MRSIFELLENRFLVLALALVSLTPLNINSALAQTTDVQSDTAQTQVEVSSNRAVGVTGYLRRVPWTNATGADLYNMRMVKMARRLEQTPGAMKNTKIWIARADICSLAGDEILMQIRSPLTCGSLGCEMVILSEASGGPQVLMRTIGDTIDAPGMNQVVVNQGTDRQRSWNYDEGRYLQKR